MNGKKVLLIRETAIAEPPAQAEPNPAAAQQQPQPEPQLPSLNPAYDPGMESIKSLAQINPAILKDPEVKKKLEDYQKGLDGFKPAEKVAETTTDKPADETTVAKPKEEEEKPAGRFSAKPPKGNIPVESFEKSADYIKQKYSIDVTTKEGTEKFLTSVDEWRANGQRAQQTLKEFEEIKNGLEQLPPEILASMQAWAEGKPYVGFITNSSPIDYTKSFDEQPDKVAVIKGLLGNDVDITAEDIASGSQDQTVKSLLVAAKALFEKEKATKEQAIRTELDSASKRRESYTASVEGSLSTLTSKYQNIEKGDLKQVKEILLDRKKFESLFFDSNGAVKSDAAIKLTFALFGEDELAKATAVAKNEAISTRNEKTVVTGKDRPPVGNTNTAPNANQQFIKQLQSLQHKPTY